MYEVMFKPYKRNHKAKEKPNVPFDDLAQSVIYSTVNSIIASGSDYFAKQLS